MNMDELRAEILNVLVEELRKALAEGKVEVKTWPSIGSVHLGGLPADVAKLFAAV